MSTDQLDDDDVSGELSGQGLNKAEFADGEMVTFTRAGGQEDLRGEAKDGKPAQPRRVLVFHNDKRMSLNQTNLRLMVKWYGPKPSAWIGHRVTVYRDESVMYAGSLTGGWRLRKPPVSKPATSAPPPVAELPADSVDDDLVPF
jgi:hypothetical protein